MDNIRAEREKQRLEKRRQRQRVVRIQRAVLAAVVLLAVAGIVAVFARSASNREQNVVEREHSSLPEETEAETMQEMDTSSSAAEPERAAEPETVAEPEEPAASAEQEALNAYENLGIANVADVLNIRQAADGASSLVGRMPAGAGCEILDTEGEWSHIRSGDIEGYVQSQYLWTGTEATQHGLEVLRQVAVVTSDQVNIRREPSTEAGTIVDEGLQGDRFEVIGQQDGWIQIPEGYLSADYVEIRYELETAEAV